MSVEPNKYQQTPRRPVASTDSVLYQYFSNFIVAGRRPPRGTRAGPAPREARLSVKRDSSNVRRRDHQSPSAWVKAKRHYAILVAVRSEAGRTPVAELLSRDLLRYFYVCTIT